MAATEPTPLTPRSTLTLRSGAAMPVMGLGTWRLTRETAATVAAALELGYRMIDTSGDYGTQRGIGEALRVVSPPREEVFIVTKVEETDDAYDAAQRNLDELQTPYADLMLIHRPPPEGAGEALWEGLLRARQDGLTRDIGVSNYRSEQIDALVRASGETPAVNQIEWSPFGRSDAMARYCDAHGVVIQAYSPLTRATRLDDERLTAIARRYGKQPAQLLIRWNLQKRTAPLPKANRRDHLEANIDVFDFAIDAGDMTALDGLNERYSALAGLPYT